MDNSPIEIAHGISNFGMMAVTCAFFLALSGLMWVACFKWFRHIINKMIADHGEVMASLLDETRKQNDLINDISEGLRPETQLRLKNTSGIYFDYSVEQVCRILKKVREENHIADKEATERKVRIMLENIHGDRDSRFDYYTYRGKRLSHFTSVEWVAWVEEALLKELYADPYNENRAHTNISAVYDRIKLDFYHRMNSL